MMSITSVLTVFLLFTSCASETPQNASTVALQKIYDNAEGRGDVSSITFADLVATGVTGLIEENLSKYLNAIARKTNFSKPARVEEVQEMVMGGNSSLYNKIVGSWHLIEYWPHPEFPEDFQYYSKNNIVWNFDSSTNMVEISIQKNIDFEVIEENHYNYELVYENNSYFLSVNNIYLGMITLTHENELVASRIAYDGPLLKFVR